MAGLEILHEGPLRFTGELLTASGTPRALFVHGWVAADGSDIVVVVGESLGWHGLAGAGLILAAVVVTELGGRGHHPTAVGGELAVLAVDDPPLGGPTSPP